MKLGLFLIVAASCAAASCVEYTDGDFAADAGPEPLPESGVAPAPPGTDGGIFVPNESGVGDAVSSPGDALWTDSEGPVYVEDPLRPDPPDPNVRCVGSELQQARQAPADTAWASAIVARSSEYSSVNWSAAQLLGAPNSYPRYGDLVTNWVTSAPDGVGEFVVVDFPPTLTRAIWIYATYNPDAIARVQSVTDPDAGGLSLYENAATVSVGFCSYVLVIPLASPTTLSRLRIDLASERVSSWNEIDAVGLVP